MKIALMHTALLDSAGGHRQILKLGIELQKRGNEVEIFTNGMDHDNCFPDLMEKLKINLIPPMIIPSFCKNSTTITKFGFGASIGMLPILNVGLSKKLKDFDVINCHNFSSHWAAYIAKQRFNIPIVWMCNEPPFWYFLSEYRKKQNLLIEYPFFHIFDKFVVKHIDEIVVLSNYTKNIVKNVYNRESIVVRTGVDFDFFTTFDDMNFRKRFGLVNNFLLLQIGGVAKYKRVMDSLNAVYYLSKKYDNIKLIIVGMGLENFYKQEVDRLGISKNILFLGYLDDQNLREAYNACDVFLFPAEQAWGLAAVEAMASSKPVIVSDRNGISEIIENGNNGFVFRFGKPEEIVNIIENLINDSNLCNAIGATAKNYVKTNLTWENYTKNMENIFKEQLSRTKL